MNPSIEYSKILCEMLVTPVYQGMASLYDVALQHKEQKNLNDMQVFRELLKSIVPRWTEQILEREVARIRDVSKQGTGLDDLFQATLKSRIALLIGNQSTLTPELNRVWSTARIETFIHKCYIFSAREVYNAPHLFSKTDDLLTDYNHRKEAIQIIEASVEKAIHHSLPITEILKSYLNKKQPTAEVGGNARPPQQVFSNPVSLLDDEGRNQVEKVFSTYNIRESLPKVIESSGGKTQQKSSFGEAPVLSHHTITNFLMNDPNVIQSESLPQSPVEE